MDINQLIINLIVSGIVAGIVGAFVSKKQGKNLDVRPLLGVACVSMLLIEVGIVSPYIGQLKPSLFTTTGGGGTIPFAGKFTLKVSTFGYYDLGADSPTNVTATFFTVKPAVGVSGEPLTLAGESVTLPEANNGVFWVDFYGGDNYYPVPNSITCSPGRIVRYYWEDYDRSGKDNLVLEVVAHDIPVQSGIEPLITIGAPDIDVDVTGITDNNPADQNLGTTSDTAFAIVWELTGISAKSGFAFTRMYAVTNSSREGTDLTFESLEISSYGGAQYFYWDAPVHKAGEGSAYEVHYIRVDDYKEWQQGILVHRPTEKEDRIYITLRGKWKGNTAGVSVTLYYDICIPTQAITSGNDAVVLNDGGQP